MQSTFGRIVTKTETINGTTTTWTYGYDVAGRLSDVLKDGAVYAHYDYDANGNRLDKTNGAGTLLAAGTYDNQDRMLTYGNNTYAYTANGELTAKTDTTTGNVTTYNYDVLGNLKHVNLPDGTAIDYVIDGRNRRIGKKVNGALTEAYLYDGQLRPIAELDASGNVISRFIYATHINVPDYMIKGGVTYKIITDHLGSPRFVIDSSTGAIAQRMDYDDFGNVLLDTAPGFTPFGFAGGLYDSQTKLVRFGARDYDPETGRWTSKDPLGIGGLDADFYGYVQNNPVNLFDPSGLTFITPEEGQLIANEASTWAGTPYAPDKADDPYKGNGAKKMVAADCSGSTWAIFQAAGFPYKYRKSSDFRNGGCFKPSPGNVPQVGDVGVFPGHLAIYAPNIDGKDIWTAFRTGKSYGRGESKYFGEVTWYRYYKPDNGCPCN
jgi:RHS repeat-associated protein